MAEATSSTPSASVDDEGPVTDNHGNLAVESNTVIEGALAKPVMNGPSLKDAGTNLQPELKTNPVSSLPNGCINHCQRVDGVSDFHEGDVANCSDSAYLIHKCDTNQSGVVNNELDTSSKTTEIQTLSTKPAETIESVSNSMVNLSISETPVDFPGDGVKLDCENGIEYVVYESEVQMPDIMRLITKDLSEPYSIYTYRYFIHNWPKLCFLAMEGKTCVGAIVCKLDLHKKMVRRGYIAMLAVDQSARRKGIGSHLVMKAIRAMVADDCDEVVLETEITNKAALHLYENLGFVRDKRLFRYYLNGVDALRLKLWLR